MSEDASTCPYCGHSPLEPNKAVVNNEVVEDGVYCPNCEEPFEEEPVHWEDLDFPEWVRYEFYEDTFGLLRKLESQTDAHPSTIPDEFSESGSDFKYQTLLVWYKVDEDGNVDGPYDERNGEKIR